MVHTYCSVMKQIKKDKCVVTRLTRKCHECFAHAVDPRSRCERRLQHVQQRDYKRLWCCQSL